MIFLRLFSGCLIQLVPFVFLCSCPFIGQFRYSLKKMIILTAAVVIGCAGVFAASGTYLSFIMPGNHSLFNAVNLIFMFCLIPCLGWYLYAVTAIWQQKLFVFSFTLTSALTITSVCNAINAWIYIDAQSDGLPYERTTSVLLLSVSVIFVPLLQLLLKRFYLPIKDGLSVKENGYMTILSLVLFIVLASGLSFINYNYLFENPMAVFLFLMLLAAVFIIYVLYFRMYFWAHEEHIAQERYIQLKYDMQLLDEQYRRIQENISSARRMRHDLNHHLILLQGLLNEKEFIKAEKYVQEYMENVTKYEMLKFCDNPVINMLISHYYTLAGEQGIDLSVRVNIPSKLSIQASDISVLLGNLLENAVRAAGAAPQDHRNIRLNILCHRKMLVITVDNSFDGNIKKDSDGSYLSSKENHTGIGLKSIRDIALKYNGGVEFKHDAKEFHSCIMLGLSDI